MEQKSLEEQWENCMDIREYLRIWMQAYPCPKCKATNLDFSAPRLGSAMICRSCHSLFDLVEKPKTEKVE